ncbi:MAG TPA: fumarylacetoacetate hydrolase family protein [Fimbriiglobus sp.]|nr:fumarylacetoacetate hydrolase family protein [Fimbriiglobus sp.]
MRLCRFQSASGPSVGFYDERGVVPLTAAAERYDAEVGRVQGELPASADLLDYLPPTGPGFGAARTLADWVAANLDRLPPALKLDPAATHLLVPVPRPNKLFLLAGNYADHIREGGGVAAERAETFPYVFLKPPSTTLTDPGRPIQVPRTAPDAVDWELELAVVIGRRCKHVREADALGHVAGYTIVNDISQRKYRPNPGRKPRERDKFFDWLHGKWFDSFCPISGVVASVDSIPDPQNLRMRLEVNGEVKQDASTAQMIFPVAAIIEFISQMCTLEPGDIISTGTPAGVGASTGTFLKPGDVMRGTIEKIGTLVTPVEAE